MDETDGGTTSRRLRLLPLPRRGSPATAEEPAPGRALRDLEHDQLIDPERLSRLRRSLLVAANDSVHAEALEWHRVARLARGTTGATAAMVNAVSDDHVLVVARAGVLPGVGARIPTAVSPCAHVVRDGAPLVVGDLALEPRTARAAPALAAAGVRSYLGVPVRDPGGWVLGTVSAFGAEARRWSGAHLDGMLDLAEVLGSRIQLDDVRRRGELADRLLADAIGSSLSGVVVADADGVVLEVNGSFSELLGWRSEEVVGRRVGEVLVPPESRGAHEVGVARARRGAPPVLVGQRTRVLALARDGSRVPVELSLVSSGSGAGARYTASLRDLRSQAVVSAQLASLDASASVVRLEVDAHGVVVRQDGPALGALAVEPGTPLRRVVGAEAASQLLQALVRKPSRAEVRAGGRTWRASSAAVEAVPGWVSGAVITLLDDSDRREAERRLRDSWRRDRLTGLLNRAGLREAVSELLATAPTAVRATTVRLRGLSETNESFGHEVGDELLRVSARRLLSALPRSAGVVTRVDAGQFCVLEVVEVPDGADDAPDGGASLPDWCASVLARLSDPVDVGAVVVVPRVVIGSATCTTEEALDSPSALVDELLRRADVALHAALRSGSPLHGYVSAEDVSARRLGIAARLRDALADPGCLGRLHLALQPVVALPWGGTRAAEALLRWEDPELGVLDPVELVAIASSSGLTGLLGLRVLAAALDEVATWWSPERQVPVMVNVTSDQVVDASLVDSVRRCLVERGLPGAALVVEVTESLALEAERARPVVEGIRALGARVHLDDFGTGWSTLERLRDLPVDGIKLDRSFCQRLPERSSLAAVRASVALAQALGVELVVEGVETAAQAQVLADAGVELGQGYLFAVPLTGAELRAQLAAEHVGAAPHRA